MNADGIINIGCRFDAGSKKPAMMDLRQLYAIVSSLSKWLAGCKYWGFYVALMLQLLLEAIW